MAGFNNHISPMRRNKPFEITLKFAGICDLCKNEIQVGERARWKRGEWIQHPNPDTCYELIQAAKDAAEYEQSGQRALKRRPFRGVI